MTDIQQKTKFWHWAKRKGLDLSRLEVANLCFDEKPIERTFKQRSRQIKDKYNHKFNFPLEHSFRGIAVLERFIINNLNIK